MRGQAWDRTDERELVEQELDEADKQEKQQPFHDGLASEAEAFKRLQPEIEASYPDQYIAMWRGQVIAVDSDKSNLVGWSFRWPSVPILIRTSKAQPRVYSIL